MGCQLCSPDSLRIAISINCVCTIKKLARTAWTIVVICLDRKVCVWLSFLTNKLANVASLLTMKILPSYNNCGHS